MRVFDIDKFSIPYQFDTLIDDKTYTMQVNYNDRHDFFTIDLYHNEELIVASEKLIYEKPLFIGLDYLDIPKSVLVPLSIDTEEERVTWDNLGKTVYLYLLGDDYEAIP